MANEFLRIGGRYVDENGKGFSKPLKTNEDGKLEISDDKILEIETQVERALKLSSGIRQEYYYGGNEVAPIKTGYKSGTGSVSKSNDYFELSVHDNPSNVAETGVYVDEKIDVTKMSTLFFEYEYEGYTSNNTRIYFSVADNPNSTHDIGDNYYVTHSGEEKIRGIAKLKVSNLTGLKYIKIHLVDRSSQVNVPAKVRIYGIWSENLKPQMANFELPEATGSNLVVKDYHDNESVDLTAVKDNDGKAALRIIDAAPYGYDSESDSIRTVNSPMEVIAGLSKEQNLAQGASFETDIVSVVDYQDIFIMADAKSTNSPLDIQVNYYMSETSANKIKVDEVVKEEGSGSYRGAVGSIKPQSPFVSLSVINKSDGNRTINLQAHGGR